MSEDEIPMQSEDLREWFNTLSKHSWYEVLKTNHDDLSVAYIDLIAEFATNLQVSLRKNCASHVSSSESLSLMQSLKPKIPEFLEPLFLSVNPGHVNEKKEPEDLACNLFTRVLLIFRRNNRSISNLYNDLDINKDGKIIFEELRAEFLKCDPSITIEESKAVFDILDGNKDGTISSHELMKRMSLIEAQAELERVDPLSCMVISKPLDPTKIHGNLSVILTRGEKLRQGTHNVKVKLADLLEYVTPDSIEMNPVWNFRSDFFIENKLESELPLLIEVELYNKKKLEGIGSFQWKKAMNTPNEFSLKVKIDIKTSTGQVRGSLSFQVMWTPIQVRIYTEQEMNKLQALEVEIEKHKKEKPVDLEDINEDIFEISDEEEDFAQAENEELIKQAIEFSNEKNKGHKGDVNERMEEFKEIERKLEDAGDSVEVVSRPGRQTLRLKKVELDKDNESKTTNIEMKRRNTSYSYVVKSGNVNVEEVVRKRILQKPNARFSVVVKKTINAKKVLKPPS